MDPDNTTSASVSAAEPETTGLFQCGSCKRHYNRPDHLARHVRSHTHSKPYRCQFCPKSFGRADLLKRHAAGHRAGTSQGSTASAAGSLAGGEVSTTCRVSRACRPCAVNHLRCSEEKPCRRCVNKCIDCVWDAASNVVVTPPPSTSAGTVVIDTPASPKSPVGVPSDYGGTPGTADMFDLGGLEPSQPMQGESVQSYMRMLSAFDFGYRPPAAFETSPMAVQGMPLAALDFDATVSTDLDDVDFRFLDAYNTNLPFEFGASPSGDSVDMTAFATQPPQDQDVVYASSPAIGTGTEAFRRHYWKFRPNAQDHGGAEEHNLSLPLAATGAGAVDADHPNSTPESRVALRRRITCARLSVASRDRILTVVTSNCRRENVARVVTSFPSVALLDTLLQYYLTSPVANADAVFHVATFDPNAKRPELLAALAAAGGVLTADATLTKLGFAIQECLRIAIPQQWERDNSLTRDLELTQAYLLTLEIGLWSGRSRKVEIAEAFFMPLLTILRRDGKFRPLLYNAASSRIAPAVVSGDEGAVLRNRWTAWVRQEAERRLAFRILQHDTSSSMALLTTPLVSYAEVLLPFPAAAALWSAATPERWKALYLAAHPDGGGGGDSNRSRHSDRVAATLPALLANPEAFGAAHRGTVDMDIVCSVFLSCAWALTWEYVQLSALQRATRAAAASAGGAELTRSMEVAAALGIRAELGQPAWTDGTTTRRWNSLIMELRQEEIRRLVHTVGLSTEMAGGPAAAPAVVMRTELILLHTHMPLEQVQLFAGMEGQDQARAVFPAIVEWLPSESARRALWHAGQVLRAARLLPRGVLWGPTAVMVYQAGLALWVYGFVAQNFPALFSPPAEADDGCDVFVDGPPDSSSSLGLKRFFALGYGRPCIRSGPHVPPGGAAADGCRESLTEFHQTRPASEAVPLSCPHKVMATLSGTIRRSHNEAARPPVVERLIHLMDEIQKASTRTTAHAGRP